MSGGDVHRSGRMGSNRVHSQQLRHKGGGMQGLEAALLQAARHQHGQQGNSGS